MRRFWLPAITGIAIIGVGLMMWNSWNFREESVVPDSAAEVIESAQEAVKEVKNYKYTTEVIIGEQIRVSALNRVIRTEKRQMVDFSWNIPNMSGSTSMYIDNRMIHVLHPLRDKWVRPEEDPAIKPFMDTLEKQLRLIDPVENLLQAEAGDRNVTIQDKRAGEQEDFIIIKVIPGPGEMAEITKSLPPQLVGATLKDISQLYWISAKDRLPIRYEVNAVVSFFGLKNMDFKVVSEPSDYNRTEIEMPKELIYQIEQCAKKVEQE